MQSLRSQSLNNVTYEMTEKAIFDDVPSTNVSGSQFRQLEFSKSPRTIIGCVKFFETLLNVSHDHSPAFISVGRRKYSRFWGKSRINLSCAD